MMSETKDSAPAGGGTTGPYGETNPPPSVAAADARKTALGLEILDIQTQLGNLNHVGATGERMTVEQWNAWRQKAKYAHQAKVREVVFLRGWAHEQRQRAATGVHTSAETAGEALRDPLTLLAALYRVCGRLLADDVPFAQSERAILQAVHRLLRDEGRI